MRRLICRAQRVWRKRYAKIWRSATKIQLHFRMMRDNQLCQYLRRERYWYIFDMSHDIAQWAEIAITCTVAQKVRCAG